MPDDGYPAKALSGVPLEGMSHQRALERLLEVMDYSALRRQQAEARAAGRHRGIGIATFVEITNPVRHVLRRRRRTDQRAGRLHRQDRRLAAARPSFSSVTEQGQGTETMIGADRRRPSRCRPPSHQGRHGRHASACRYGGGTWACRGAGIGGEACLQAAQAAGGEHPRTGRRGPAGRPGRARHRGTAPWWTPTPGRERMALAEIGRIGYFRGDTAAARCPGPSSPSPAT